MDSSGFELGFSEPVKFIFYIKVDRFTSFSVLEDRHMALQKYSEK